VQLKDALNTVWEVETPPGSGIWRFVRTYVWSLAGVLSLGFLLLISMLLTAGLSAAGKYIAPYLPEAMLQVHACGLRPSHPRARGVGGRWYLRQRHGLPLQPIDLAVQRGDGLTIPHTSR
jgi:hypothetical protein